MISIDSQNHFFKENYWKIYWKFLNNTLKILDFFVNEIVNRFVFDFFQYLNYPTINRC
jgi:hypothetical protein